MQVQMPMQMQMQMQMPLQRRNGKGSRECLPKGPHERHPGSFVDEREDFSQPGDGAG